jgi:hypothetical protein
MKKLPVLLLLSLICFGAMDSYAAPVKHHYKHHRKKHVVHRAHVKR